MHGRADSPVAAERVTEKYAWIRARMPTADDVRYHNFAAPKLDVGVGGWLLPQRDRRVRSAL